MRRRLKAPEFVDCAIYHCVSRVVDRRRVFGEAEKERFVKLMRMYERLYGLRVVTFCVMTNHFHVLVEVPKRPAVLPSNEELVGLIGEVHGRGRAQRVAGWFERWEAGGNVQAIEQERERWFRQMWDVSRFMKVLKQRFTQWFNARHRDRRRRRRHGTLWEERFRSVLVESGEALRAMAAYIDLNPVRGKLVSDPKDYRWSGYGEACAGKALAKAGLWRAARSGDPSLGAEGSERGAGGFDVLAWYREQLFGRGLELRTADGQVVRPGFSPAQIEKVRDQRGRLPGHLFLRLRVRSFTDGLVLGSKAFVDSVVAASGDLFSRKRRTGAKRLKGLEFDSPLRAARGLVVRPSG